MTVRMMSFTPAQMQYQGPPPPLGGTQMIHPTMMPSMSLNPNTASAASSALVNNFLQAKAQVDGYDASDLEPTPISGVRSHGVATNSSTSPGFPPPPTHLIAPQPSYFNGVPPTVFVPATHQQKQQPLAPRPQLPPAMSSYLPNPALPMVHVPSSTVQPKTPVLVPESNPSKRKLVSGNGRTRKMTVGRR